MSVDNHLLDDSSATSLIQAWASLSEEALAIVAEDQTPRSSLDRLVAENLFPDAIKILALVLPKPQAVWWACRCCREVTTSEESPAAVAALEAAERWATEPSEPNRRAAQASAESVGLESPAGCAAMGAFFSDGSLAPPGVPDVPPAAHLTAHMIAGAIMLCAVRSEPENAPVKYRAFLTIGLNIADSTDLPPQITSAPAPGITTATKPNLPSTFSDTPQSPSSASSRNKRWDEWE